MATIGEASVTVRVGKASQGILGAVHSKIWRLVRLLYVPIGSSLFQQKAVLDGRE
jgi:hypothetical protein